MRILYSLIIMAIAQTLSAQTFTTYTVDDGLINNSVSCVSVDNDNNVWFGTQEGLSYYNGSIWQNFDQTSVPELISNTIKAVFVDSNDKLWVGTDFGVNAYDGTTWTTYTEEDGLADNRIKYINQAPDGSIWFANSDGVSKYDGSTWLSYTSDQGIPFGGVSYITFDTDGTPYMGSPLFGLMILENEEITILTTADGLLSDKVRTIAIDQDGHKWIGTSDGLTELDADNQFVTNHLKIFELPPPNELNPIEDIKIDCEGNVWVGIYIDYLLTEGGLSIYRDNIWEDYDKNTGIAGPVVSKLDIDTEGNVWIATSTGVTLATNELECVSSVIPEQEYKAVAIYPNPASISLTIANLISHQDKLISINDISGRVAMKINSTSDEMTIDVSRLAKGMYFLTIDGHFIEKLLIE